MASSNHHISLEHELTELADQIHALFFLSGGNCSQSQLDDYSEQLTHILRYARSLGYRAAILSATTGIEIHWEPLGGANNDALD